MTVIGGLGIIFLAIIGFFIFGTIVGKTFDGNSSVAKFIVGAVIVIILLVAITGYVRGSRPVDDIEVPVLDR